MACARPENNIAGVSARSGDGSLRLRMSSFDSIMMRARESTPQSDVATRCFRDGFAPLPTACVNQDAVPV